MSDSSRRDLPSPFVGEWIRRLSPSRGGRARALDLAAGSGRHSAELLRAGYRVFAVDRRLAPLQELRRRERADSEADSGRLMAWAADLTQSPLPRAFFELVIVARYLQRDLFPALESSLVPGGVLIYETFTEAQRALGSGPRSPDHLLAPGELRMRCRGLEVFFYEEVTSPEAVARIVARRPFRESNASTDKETSPSRTAP